MAAPGTPKTTSTPSLSITFTTASITFIFGIAVVSSGRRGGRADRVLGQVLDEGEQRGVVAVAHPARAQRLEHLVHRRRGRQRDPVLARGGERDAEVLVVQVDSEARSEVVLEEVAPAHVHDAVGGE